MLEGGIIAKLLEEKWKTFAQVKKDNILKHYTPLMNSIQICERLKAWTLLKISPISRACS